LLTLVNVACINLSVPPGEWQAEIFIGKQNGSMPKVGTRDIILVVFQLVIGHVNAVTISGFPGK
jgi:hypothetical protein